MPSAQPETALAAFTRALGNRDIATGTIDTVAGTGGSGGGNGEDLYGSVGQADARATRSEPPPQRTWFCYVLAPGTCTAEQIAAVGDGSARVVRYIVEDSNSTMLFPEIFGGGYVTIGKADRRDCY